MTGKKIRQVTLFLPTFSLLFHFTHLCDISTLYFAVSSHTDSLLGSYAQKCRQRSIRYMPCVFVAVKRCFGVCIFSLLYQLMYHFLVFCSHHTHFPESMFIETIVYLMQTFGRPRGARWLDGSQVTLICPIFLAFIYPPTIIHVLAHFFSCKSLAAVFVSL